MTQSSAISVETSRAARANNPETLVVSAIGAVATGKSSLLNSIADERLFTTGEGYATTKTVLGEVRQWKYIPTTKYALLIDTPGLCDSSTQDRAIVQEMVRYFKSLAYGVSAFLLVFDIRDLRLDAYTQDMLQLFQQLLGKDFWNFVVIVFTHVDDDLVDELDDNIEAVLDPTDGFVPELARIFKLPRKTFSPSVVFTSAYNVRTSGHSQKGIRDVYNAVVRCETRNDGRRFNCTWLRQIIAHQTEEEKTEFVKQSIIAAMANVALTVCHIQ